MAVISGTALMGGAITAGTVAAGATMATGVYGAYSDRKSAKQSIKSQEAQKQASMDYIERNINQARGDIFKLFPSAQESRQKGIEAGIGMFNKSMPFQMNAFQQGNVGAQQALSQGLPQVQNAILGNPVDMNAIQPRQINPGIQGLMASSAPQFEGIDAAMNTMPQPQPQQLDYQSLMRMWSGY